MQKSVWIIVGVAALLVLIAALSFSDSVMLGPTPYMLQCGEIKDLSYAGNPITVTKSGVVHHDILAQPPPDIAAEVDAKCAELTDAAVQECLDGLRNVILNGRTFTCDTCPDGKVGTCDPDTGLPTADATPPVALVVSNCISVTTHSGLNPQGQPTTASTQVQVSAMCGGAGGYIQLECVNMCTDPPQQPGITPAPDGGGPVEEGGKGTGR